jgi:hypothetical protein
LAFLANFFFFCLFWKFLDLMQPTYRVQKSDQDDSVEGTKRARNMTMLWFPVQRLSWWFSISFSWQGLGSPII